MTTRLTIDASGYIQNRRIARDESLLVATEIVTGQHEVRPHVPEIHAGAFEEVVRDMTRRSSDLDALVRQLHPPPAPRPIEPTPEVLAFEPPEILNNAALLRRALGRRASALNDCAEAGIKRPNTPKFKAGQILKNHFFAEGLAFTQHDYDQQWLEFGRRFDDVPDAVAAAAALLACDDLLVEVKPLNDHFGRLLGLTERTLTPAPIATPEALHEAHFALVSVLMRALALAFTIWPRPDFTDAAHRRRFVGPFLTALTD